MVFVLEVYGRRPMAEKRLIQIYFTRLFYFLSDCLCYTNTIGPHSLVEYKLVVHRALEAWAGIPHGLQISSSF